MFGMFGKKELENSSFNNILITSLVESVRRHGRLPDADELIGYVNDLSAKVGKKLSISQIGSLRGCAATFKLESTQSEIIPLLRGIQKEIPVGGRKSYDATFQLLSRYGLIMDDSSIEFMKKYGLK
jgi:hypothetical protein